MAKDNKVKAELLSIVEKKNPFLEFEVQVRVRSICLCVSGNSMNDLLVAEVDLVWDPWHVRCRMIVTAVESEKGFFNWSMFIYRFCDLKNAPRIFQYHWSKN